MSVKYHIFPIFLLHFWYKYEEILFFFSRQVLTHETTALPQKIAHNQIFWEILIAVHVT